MLDQEGYQQLVLVVDGVVQGAVTELSYCDQMNEPYHIDFVINFVSILSIEMLAHRIHISQG